MRPDTLAGAAGALLLLGATSAAAQTTRADPRDLEGWYTAAVHLDLPRRWETSLQYRLRTSDDASVYRGSHVTASVRHGIRRRLDLLASGRFAWGRDERARRWSLGAEGTAKRRGATIALRSLVQHGREGSGDRETLLRARLETERALARRLDVYASVEPHFDLEDGHAVDGWRNTFGLRHEYAKGRKIGVFYIFRPDYSKSYNRTFHVIGVDLDLDVRPRRR